MDILKEYIEWKKENPDTWISYTVEQKDLLNAIQVAVHSKNKIGKMNRHQCRIKQICYKEFEENLIKRYNELEHVTDFDLLYQITWLSKPHGVGDLFCYDVAVRIGNFLNLQPEFVYLHAGTKVGLENLKGKKISVSKISKADLPEPFKSCQLTCHDIEVLLCVYKDRFKK